MWSKPIKTLLLLREAGGADDDKFVVTVVEAAIVQLETCDLCLKELAAGVAGVLEDCWVAGSAGWSDDNEKAAE